VSRAIAEHMRRIVLDPTDEASWSLFLLSVYLLLWPRRRGGLAGIRELRDRVRRFEAGEWGELAAERISSQRRIKLPEDPVSRDSQREFLRGLRRQPERGTMRRGAGRKLGLWQGLGSYREQSGHWQ
jgi:hypothetical protein